MGNNFGDHSIFNVTHQPAEMDVHILPKSCNCSNSLAESPHQSQNL